LTLQPAQIMCSAWQSGHRQDVPKRGLEGNGTMRIGRRHLLAMGAGALLAGCNLPRGAANGRALLASATKDESGGYAVYQVNQPFLHRLSQWPVTGNGPSGGWLAGGSGRGTATIRPGDKLDIVVWDNSETSLLAASGAKQVALTGISVSGDGKIFVPYLDRVSVAGRTTEAARADLQDRFTTIAPSAQVQLSMAAGRNNSVDVVGGVARPGSYPLADGSLTVLGLIAAAGGVNAALATPTVRLVRGGRTYVTTLDRLYQNASLDTGLVGGDRIIVDQERRKFVALGAAGREQIVTFPVDRLNALDAIAAAGGVNDFRGDPKAILILREYPADAVKDGLFGPSAPRVLFVINLTTADGLFSARRFMINPDDVVYVSESPVTGFATVTQIAGSIFNITRQVESIAQ
jgi:polysaccharide biosynthesis/export protein